MRNHVYQSYFDNEVMGASPLKLIEMLYAAARDSIAAARRCIRSGDISARTRSINKALRIVSELSLCLKPEAEKAISRNLAGLYAYIMRLLVEANIKQSEAPLAEAEDLLSTLAEAWKACTPVTAPPVLPNTEPPRRDAYARRESATAAL